MTRILPTVFLIAIAAVVLPVVLAVHQHQQRCSWPVHTYQSCEDNQ